MKSWLEVFPEFYGLAEFFKSQGYVVTVEELDNYASVTVTNEGIRGAFCTPNTESYRILDGRFAADNIFAFNKWSQCPLCVAIPTDLEVLKENLKFLSSSEGYEHSNSFAYLDSRILPFELDFKP